VQSNVRERRKEATCFTTFWRGIAGRPSCPSHGARWSPPARFECDAATSQQRKALMRLLVKELRVMSREEIRPTYKIPPVVRAPEGQVEVA
jgi:hypothetical protein